ncbi:MAG: helix-turn-helix transcriptional regulator [Sphingomonadales bacterium]|jgi:transcriptional regulator with XRE-family HTH domain
MRSRIREIRKAKGLTLAEVAERIKPEPSTAQTIGRLETGMRTLSVEWLNRIAKALEVEPSELITLPQQADCPIMGEILADGFIHPIPTEMVDLRLAAKDPLAIRVSEVYDDFIPGDIIIFDRVAGDALYLLDGQDCLIETADGLSCFGRLLMEPEGSVNIATSRPEAKVYRDLRPVWGAKMVMLIRHF